MKKLISLSLIGCLFSLNLSANQELALGKLKKIPLNLDLLSFENGGNKSAIDAYSDGVGLYTVGLEDKKFSAMNELVFVYGEEAKKSGETLKEFVISNGSNEEQELANLLGTTISGTVIGAPCDDGVATTENDRYIDTNGTCQGTEIIVRNSVKCEGEEIGSEILVDGISYLIVDNDSIRNNLDRAETLCTSNVTNINNLFNGSENKTYNLNNWDTSNITGMSFLFAQSNNSIFYINNWDVSKVVDFSFMFAYLYNNNQDMFNNLNLENWNTKNANNFFAMFKDTYINTNINISNFNTTLVTDMSYMFESGKFNENINNWDVSNVISMNNMFSMNSEFNQPLNNWNVSNVNNMFAMFSSTPFNLDISDWNVSNVEDMRFMFAYSNFNKNISNWQTNKINNFERFSLNSAHGFALDSDLLAENNPFIN